MKLFLPEGNLGFFNNTYHRSRWTWWSRQTCAPLSTGRTLQRGRIKSETIYLFHSFGVWTAVLLDKRIQEFLFWKTSLSVSPGHQCLLLLDCPAWRECTLNFKILEMWAVQTKCWTNYEATFTPGGPGIPVGPMGPWHRKQEIEV